MRYFVEEYKNKYERLMLKFKEKKIECDVLKDECKVLKQKIKSLQKKKKSASIGDKEMVRIGYLEDEYRKMESEEKEKGVRLNEEIEGLKCANKRANDEVEELKIQATMLMKTNVKLGEELEDYKAKYEGLLAQLNEKAGLEVGLKEMVKILEEENQKIKMDQRENCAKLRKEIEDLGCAKRNADDEIEALERKCMELEVQGTVSLNYVIELEKQLTNQMSIMVHQDDELMDLRARCNGMSEREMTALGKVACLEEVVKKMECDKRETENRILKSWKGKAGEMESWEKRLPELETGVLSAEEGNLSLRGPKNEVSCRKMHDKVDVADMVHPELIDSMLIEPNINPSSFQGNSEDVHDQ
ncbi:hypothetical protein MKW94_009431, partial [Papaver nudicaule]|nr:hypothetical protein [Papaver nudicaule]